MASGASLVSRKLGGAILIAGCLALLVGCAAIGAKVTDGPSAASSAASAAATTIEVDGRPAML